MYKLKILFAVIAAAIIGLSLNVAQHHASRSGGSNEAKAVAENTTDPILESFLRELDHKPLTVWHPRRDAIDDDVLYEALNKIHWTSPTESTGRPVSVDAEDAE